MNKKVLSVVLNNFKNDSRVKKEACSLGKLGFTVKVVAFKSEDVSEFEEQDLYSVHRVRLSSKKWPRVKGIQFFKYLEFVARVILNHRDYAIIHCHDFQALPIGFLIKAMNRGATKIVYDAHEYQTETKGISQFRKQVVVFLERIMVKRVDAMITVSKSIAKEYVKNYNIEEPNLIVNSPHFLEIDKKDLFRKELNISEDQKIFLFQGGLTTGRGIELVLSAFDKLNNDNVVVFLGDGPLKRQVLEHAQKNENIFYLPFVDYEVLLDYSSSADYGLLLYENICLNHYYCLPNKLFEYSMAGLPILGSNLLEVESIIKEYDIGYVLEEFNSDTLVKLINQLSAIQGIKENTTKFNKDFCWEKQEKKLDTIYQQLTQLK